MQKSELNTFEDIKTFINMLEVNFPVESWGRKDLLLWPYIRIKLYFEGCTIISKKDREYPLSEKNKSIVASKRKSFIGKIVEVLQLIWFLLSLKKRKLIFFSIKIHRALLDSVSFNRFFDSMIDFHNLQNKAYTFELDRIQDSMYNKINVFYITQFLRTYSALLKIKMRFFVKKVNSNNDFILPEYDTFLNVLDSFNISPQKLGITPNDLFSWSNKIKEDAKFFVAIFNKIQPDKIIAISYYGYDLMSAALHAANQLNIKTIDLQHGPQADIHMAYASWLKVPKTGYSIMPKEYWNWDEPSAASISLWGKVNNISSIVVGHPWLAYLNSSSNSNVVKSNNIILYSLQLFPPYTIEDMFPEGILTFMRTYNYLTILRLHPRNNLNVRDLSDYLIANDVPLHKFEIQKAQDFPLPFSLMNSLLHITNFSGTLIEAETLGVPTVIIDKFGQEVFKNYINNSTVCYSNKWDVNFSRNLKSIIDQLPLSNKNIKLEVFNPLL